MTRKDMILTIVIPALNEEEAIGGTIKRCLAARERIRSGAGVSDVRIVAVSDGSTDRTPEIARSFPEVQVIVFPENRGYGAAIKTGWAQGGGDLLAFLDADGTCDPEYFVPMCRAIVAGEQDLVLGCRMGSDSQMPRIRRVGNTLFAVLLGLLSRKKVRDTASGMRVLRADVLPKLLPLPDGLHFTPAMSARALMDNEVRIHEIDMQYKERIGRSKLRAIRDGFRFLSVILSAAAYLQVSRLTLPLITLLGLACGALMITPIASFVGHGHLEDWMIYRVALAGMLGTIGVTLLCSTIVSEHVAALALLRYGRFSPGTRGLWRYETLKVFCIAALGVWCVALALNVRGVRELLGTGHVTLHWSRVLIGAFCSINLAQLLGTLCTLKIVRALHQRQPFIQPTTTEPGR
ncbi:MAG TPA: glycosyltransferase family 2 protein [Candidatus Polarisedimenticolia bacterium]|nr:glycosyltransferase family 2 protein [Candidatus Polarisedimenticolia bacterium]